ncbi:Tox-REase-5 domain-containing protein [Paraburkholderia kururiensis]|uniref:Tox-REase-5 domain-containing protein n=1 Tax=Paraburkholderia kururiensis TaxID=984307 RepID=UPI0039A61273
MAVIFLPVLEAAGAALAEAVPAAAGTAIAGILTSPGDTSKDESDAKSTARAVPKSGERCKRCPPDEGTLVTRNWNMSETSRQYQAYATGFAPQTEWNFGGLDFDGFRSSMCQLEEAKAKYDQFFNRETGKPKYFFSLFGVGKIRAQASAQSAVVAANPPSLLRWYFMQPVSHAFFARVFRTAAPLVQTELKPLPVASLEQ